MTAPVPFVEVTDDARATRVGCPNGKCHAVDAVDALAMRAERFPEAQVRAFGDQVSIEFAEQGSEPVSIFELFPAVSIVGGQRVGKRFTLARKTRDEKTILLAFHRIERARSPVARKRAVGVRQGSSYQNRAILGVHAQKREWIVPVTFLHVR